MENLDFAKVEELIHKLDIPGPPFLGGSDRPSAQQELRWVQGRTAWFRQTEANGTNVLWIVVTDSMTAYRWVTEAWLGAWGPSILMAQSLWIQVDANNYIRGWQVGRNIG